MVREYWLMRRRGDKVSSSREEHKPETGIRKKVGASDGTRMFLPRSEDLGKARFWQARHTPSQSLQYRDKVATAR